MRFPTSIKFQRSFLLALVMAPLSHCISQDELQLCLEGKLSNYHALCLGLLTSVFTNYCPVQPCIASPPL